MTDIRPGDIRPGDMRQGETNVQLGVPNLQLGELIGGGGFASVYRGYDSLLRRDLAVKILRPAGGIELRQAFEAEAAAHGPLSRHPNIVTIHHAGFTTDGRPYLVMDYVAGGSLGDYVAEHGPVPWHHVVAWMIPICAAVQHAHDQGILHRDVKPDNILLDPPGTPLLSDLGIACLRDDTSPVPAMSFGHAAPEALRGERRDTRSDVYSLGSTIYQVLSGTLPHGNDVYARLRQIDDAPPPLPPHLGAPIWLEDLMRRAMACDIDHRTVSARELGRQLEVGAGQVTLDHPTVVARPARSDGTVIDSRPPHPSLVPSDPWAGPDLRGGTNPSAAPTAASTDGTTGPRPPQRPLLVSRATLDPAVDPFPFAYPPDPSTTGSGLTTFTPAQPQPRAHPQPMSTVVVTRRGPGMAAMAVLVALAAVACTLAFVWYPRTPDEGAASVPAPSGPDVQTAATVAHAGTTVTGATAGPGSTEPTIEFGAGASTGSESGAGSPNTSTNGGSGSGESEPVGTDTKPGPGPEPGPEQLTVADVIGDDVPTASGTLGVSFTVETEDELRCDFPAGRVVRTDPGAGSSVEVTDGTKPVVTLTVSSRPDVTVPNVKGMTESEARTALTGVPLAPSVSYKSLADGSPDIGKVITQSLAEDSSAEACTQVTLTVGRKTFGSIPLPPGGKIDPGSVTGTTVPATTTTQTTVARLAR